MTPVAEDGGNGGGGECHPASTAPEQLVRSRVAFVSGEEFSLNPHSLVGSWFHRLENDQIVWQGVVVAEPAQAVYLLNVEFLDEGATNVQRLMKLDQLTNDDDGYDWRFYDTREDAVAAYASWLAFEKERT
jgi:hypothetical protein